MATPTPTRDVDPLSQPSAPGGEGGRTRRALQNAILVIGSCALGLAAVEAGLRAWELLDSSQTSLDPLNRFDPLLGWANRAGAR